MPDHVAEFAGGAGTVISNLSVFSHLTGTAVRYRIYASLGFDLGWVAGIIAISWVAFWFGMMLIFGTLSLGHPAGLSAVLPIDGPIEVVIGVCFITGSFGVFLWMSRA